MFVIMNKLARIRKTKGCERTRSLRVVLENSWNITDACFGEMKETVRDRLNRLAVLRKGRVGSGSCSSVIDARSAVVSLVFSPPTRRTDTSVYVHINSHLRLDNKVSKRQTRRPG